MQAALITITMITVFFSNSLASAQSSNESYQHLWYGYNQFIETPGQKELRITCGDLSENEYKVFDWIFGDYKLVKFNNQIRVMVQSDKRNKFVVTPANHKETKYDTGYTFGFRENVPYMFSNLHMSDMQKLLKAFESFVPAAQKGTVWQAIDAITPMPYFEWEFVEEWEKYFKILNVHDDYLWLNLEKGTISRLGFESEIQVSVEIRTTATKEAQGKRYNTQNKYFFRNRELNYDCLSWKPFN